MTNEELLKTALEAAEDRGREYRRWLDELPPSLKIDIAARDMYYAGPGGEMGSFDWNELPEVDVEHRSYDKSTYRAQAWAAARVFGFSEEVLRDHDRWEWLRRDQLPRDDLGRWINQQAKEGWQYVVGRLRRKRLTEREENARTVALSLWDGAEITEITTEDGVTRVTAMIPAILGATYHQLVVAPDGSFTTKEHIERIG